MQNPLCPHLSPSFLAMKFTLLLLTLFGLAASGRSHSQPITLAVKDAPLATIFQRLQQQTGYSFVYTQQQLQSCKPVTVRLQQVPFTEALDQLFAGQPIQYQLELPYIIIREKASPVSVLVNSPTPLVLSGTVRNEQGEAVAGATVAIRNRPEATSTDGQGRFSLATAQPGDVLQVSSIGYQSYSEKITSSKELSIVLVQQIDELDQAIVIGYGTSSKRYSVGSVSKVSSQDISRQPIANPLAALQGRASGVFVQTQNGLPGGNIKVQIRGQGSVAAGTNPLFIIDGVPFLSAPFSSAAAANGANGAISPFSIINPNDIESIEVLKDAEATAIYGSRAANGVVLITTKKGKAGKSKVDLTVYKGFNSVQRTVDYMNVTDYLQVRREAYANAGLTPTIADAPDLLKWDTTHVTNWQDYVFGGKGSILNAQIDVSGGSAQTHFLLGGNFRHEGTPIPGNQAYVRGGGHLSVSHESTDKRFGMDSRVLVSRDHNEVPYNTDIASYVTLPPHFPIYHPDGTLNWDLGYNPLASLNRVSESQSTNIVANSTFRYRITSSLQLKLSAGYSLMNLNRTAILPKSAINPINSLISSSIFATNSQENYILEPYVTFNKSIGKIKLNATIGGTYQQSLSKGESKQGSNFSNDALLSNIGAAGLISNQANDYIEHKYVSGFIRLESRWKDRYIFSTNFRRDGSSRFGPAKLFGNFGSVAAGWIFTNERSFFPSTSAMSFGKLRLSYGLTGNDQIPDYAYLSTYGSGSIYQNLPGLRPLRIANKNYEWESNHKLEGGLETGFFNDRLLFNVHYFHNKSGNQLVPYPLPSQTGFTQYQANLPAIVLNNGWEFELFYSTAPTNKLNWRGSVNLTLPNNKLLAYPGLEGSSYASIYEIGKDLSLVKRIHFTGVNQSTGNPEFLDVNGDGQFSFPQDYIAVGKTSPDFFGGVTNDFSYRNWELSLFLQFSGQHALGNFTYPGYTLQNDIQQSVFRWRKPGDVTQVPIPIVPSATPAFNALVQMPNSDYYLFNNSYIRIKSLQIAWKAPPPLLAKSGLTQLRLFLEGQNLWTLTNKKIGDPETLNGSNAVMPVMQIFSFGIQLTF